MDQDIERIRSQFIAELSAVASLKALDELETAYLGRKGAINALFGTFSNLTAEEIKSAGQSINSLKSTIVDAITSKRLEIAQDTSSLSWSDPTLPGEKHPLGGLHLVTHTIRDIRTIFHSLGFIHMSYPEVEWEQYAFDSLNMPKIHPARDDFETFFVNEPAHPEFGKMLLTPHTSNGQVREMHRIMKEGGKPPIKMINISRTYRPNWDATHTPMFHQFEGLCIDKNITIAHLKGTIEYFVKEFFGRDRKIRLRPYDFLFTEPSFEVDIFTGSESIGRAGWLELGGAGMVHPNVLTAGGIDPDEYTGWAFGFGIERVAMMRGGVALDDLRVTYSGDVRFLEQFA